MSFATEVKSEIGQNYLKDCCRRAQLSALIQLCSTINISSAGLNLLVRTENATTAKRIWSLLKETYSAEMELSVIRKMKLKKNNIYVIRVKGQAREILDDLTLYQQGHLREHPLFDVVHKDCCARAYLAGAFMASGSVNSPQKTNYHLEISTLRESHAAYIQKIMMRFSLPARMIQRRNQYVVYLKASEKISDFLRLIGAHEAVLNFEDMRIQRDFRNSIQRLDNCELANEVKSIEAGKKQMESIRILEENVQMDLLDKKVLEIIALRKKFPDYSLIDLCTEYEQMTGISISKSGMKHRLQKIVDLAEKVKGE